MKASWIGTTSNVEHEREPGTQPGSKGIEHYKFILLGSKQKPDGSEERFEKSVKMQGGDISGGVVNGRQVVVEGEEGKDGWIRATKIIDKSTGAVTEPQKQSGDWKKGFTMIGVIVFLIVFVAVAMLILSIASEIFQLGF